MLTRLPALVDVHVHMREPGATHKEDWDTGTAAALAGGFTAVLTMPNTQPAVVDAPGLDLALQAANQKARCDYAQFLGGNASNAQAAAALTKKVAGLKLYLDQTFGDLKVDDMSDWQKHFELWPRNATLAVHAEGKTMAAAILLASLFRRSLHICHVSTREEIQLIRKAKESGVAVTCEVCPHHLFLSEEDLAALGPGRCEVRPRLAKKSDQQALWANLDIVDCFATDHAPHTLAEKDGPNPPPGFPGLETILPLLLNAVHESRLTLEDIVSRLHTNPHRIYGIPLQAESFCEVDLEAGYEIHASQLLSKCGWTPYEGWRGHGRVVRTVLRGETAFADGKVLAAPGTGKNIRIH
jgi:carbamoyl-phosphate synthase/aspartate carbamoyltransferase/dihydroorotase